MTVGQYTVGSWQQKTELRFESSQVRCHDEKFLHGLDPTDQQQCAVTRGRWRLTAAPTGLDSTGTPDCAWVYTHRPTAVSLHFAPCCTARDLTNWHRQAVQFSSHLTHTSRLHSSLRLPSHIVTQSNFCALSGRMQIKLVLSHSSSYRYIPWFSADASRQPPEVAFHSNLFLIQICPWFKKETIQS